jgi:hypothetical protein
LKNENRSLLEVDTSGEGRVKEGNMAVCFTYSMKTKAKNLGEIILSRDEGVRESGGDASKIH